MRRIDIPATDTESGEPMVEISGRTDQMNRLARGVLAYRAGLLALRGFGVQANDPADVDTLISYMQATRTQGEVIRPHDSAEKRTTIVLSLEQAGMLATAAQTMLDVGEMLRQGSLAFGPDGALPAEYETGEWQIIAAALAPPEPNPA